MIRPLKRFVRSVNTEQCDKVVGQSLMLDSNVRVAALLRDRDGRAAPDVFAWQVVG